MIKTLPLLAILIFAPPLVFLAMGSQLIYASHLMRRQRLIDRAQERIRTHTLLAAGHLS